MPHSSATTMITKPTTNYYELSPKEDKRNYLYTIPTPPPCSSPIELPPLLNLYDSHDNRPPSPDSPKLKRFSISSFDDLPSYLEPNPQIKLDTPNFIFDLFNFNQTRISRSVNNQHHYHHHTIQPSTKHMIPPIISTKTPMSPIMAAASASAASLASQRHPGSQVAKSLLDSIGQSDLSFNNSKRKKRKSSQDPIVDQSMFLTKNAHIKRPRNAWIHFRCHYGQALKSQDPTLRAEEISKRASQRWGKLTENEKKPWHGLAEQEKLAHREAFPEYRYCPRRANPTNNTNRPRSASDDSIQIHDLFHRTKKMKRTK